MGTLKNTLRIIMYKFGVAGMVMISGFLVPRYLSVPDNGIYKLTQLYFQLAYTYLSGYSFFYNYGLNRQGLDRRQLVAVIMRIYFWIAVGSGVLLVVSLCFMHVDAVFLYVAFAIATVPMAVLFTYGTKLIQALNEISWLNRLNMVQGLLFLIFAAVITVLGRWQGFVHTHLLWLTMVAWFASWVIAAVAAFIMAVRLSGVSLRPQRFPDIAKMVYPYGRRVSMQQLLTQFNLRGDLMLVGLLVGTAAQNLRAAGLYAVAVTASEVLWHISSSLSLLVYTRIAKEKRQDSIALTARVFRFTLLMLIVAAMGLAMVFPPIIHYLLKGRYDEAIPAFYILLVGAIAYGTTQLFTQFFTDQLGKVRFPLYMQSVSIATNVLVCVILIPHVYIYGGAIASSTAYFVGLGMNLWYFKRQTERKIWTLFVFDHDDLALFGIRRKRVTNGAGGGAARIDRVEDMVMVVDSRVKELKRRITDELAITLVMSGDDFLSSLGGNSSGLDAAWTELLKLIENYDENQRIMQSSISQLHDLVEMLQDFLDKRQYRQSEISKKPEDGVSLFQGIKAEDK